MPASGRGGNPYCFTFSSDVVYKLEEAEILRQLLLRNTFKSFPCMGLPALIGKQAYSYGENK
jgi:hypothetical protein